MQLQGGGDVDISGSAAGDAVGAPPDRRLGDVGDRRQRRWGVPHAFEAVGERVPHPASAASSAGQVLVVRSGDVVGEVCKVAAETDADEVHMAADVSGYAQRREQRLRRALEAEGRRLHVHDTVTTAVAPVR